MLRLCCFVVLFWLVGCAQVEYRQLADAPARQAGFALLPFNNLSESPQAGERAEVIALSLLRQNGVRIEGYPPRLGADPLAGVARDSQKSAEDWARGAGHRYALTGSVTEWRYKVGVDGEPAVGLTLTLLDLHNGQPVWTASGARTGWSREALSAVAQRLLQAELNGLRLAD